MDRHIFAVGPRGPSHGRCGSNRRWDTMIVRRRPGVWAHLPLLLMLRGRWAWQRYGLDRVLWRTLNRTLNTLNRALVRDMNNALVVGDLGGALDRALHRGDHGLRWHTWLHRLGRDLFLD